MLSRLGAVFQKILQANGGISFGRFASMLMLFSCISWDTAYTAYIMWNFSRFHFGAGDILVQPTTLLGQVAAVSSTYAVNKLTAPQSPGNGNGKAS